MLLIFNSERVRFCLHIFRHLENRSDDVLSVPLEVRNVLLSNNHFHWAPLLLWLELEEEEREEGERKCLNKENLITAFTLISPTSLKQNNISRENYYFILSSFTSCFLCPELSVVVGWSVLSCKSLETKTPSGRRAMNHCRLLARPGNPLKYFHSLGERIFLLPKLSKYWRVNCMIGCRCCNCCCSCSLMLCSLSLCLLGSKAGRVSVLSSNNTRPAGPNTATVLALHTAGRTAPVSTIYFRL